jgi:hypothetical protein
MSDFGAVGEPVHSGGKSIAPVWPPQRLDGPFAGLKEQDHMNTSELDLTQERELQDGELDAVSGGLANCETAVFKAFLGGIVKGYLGAGGDVSVKFL